MDINKIHEGQPNQTTDETKQGAKAEMAKAEALARSVGGDTTSPTLSGGKTSKQDKPVANISVGKKTSKK
jgi:hypothetical protein